MLDRKIVCNIAAKVLEEHGHQIVRVLRDHERLTEGNSAAAPSNLLALMELFAHRLNEELPDGRGRMQLAREALIHFESFPGGADQQGLALLRRACETLREGVEP